MPFLDTNSHPTTKPYNFDIKCQGNSESYDRHGFFWTKFRGGQNCLITLGGVYNEREYSGADWPVFLLVFLNGPFYSIFSLNFLPNHKSKKVKAELTTYLPYSSSK